MTGNIAVTSYDPFSSPARALSDALWDEVKSRYGFTGPNRFDMAKFTGPPGGFWVATATDEPVGCLALHPPEGPAAELDVLYVAPEHRGTGVAQALLDVVEDHARASGISVLRLRTGEPQPEALRFFAAAGYAAIPCFGKWIWDPTARCLQKSLD